MGIREFLGIDRGPEDTPSERWADDHPLAAGVLVVVAAGAIAVLALVNTDSIMLAAVIAFGGGVAAWNLLRDHRRRAELHDDPTADDDLPPS